MKWRPCGWSAGLATIIELCSEPLYIIAHVWLRFDLRLAVEGMATFTKGLFTLALLEFTTINSVTVFAQSQIAFAVVTLIGYGTLIPEIVKKVLLFCCWSTHLVCTAGTSACCNLSFRVMDK